jgi:nucleotide-binding universal stress UspA family protein
MLLLVPEGRHQPCLASCVLNVKQGVVTIEGPSRQRVFDQARRFFRAHARKLPALQIAAIVEQPRFGDTPAGMLRERAAARDAWTIVINSDVTFTPSGIDPDIERAPAIPAPPPRRERPQLTIISAG